MSVERSAFSVERSTPSGAVFLSYAREDSESARRIADALRAFGVEVWFDQHELRGGDAWDAKIKKQIRECALFVPIVSAHTQARPEGYFRREWHLAIDRLRDMSSSRAFIAPVVIDAIGANEADVPEEFLRYQWTQLANGVPSPEFVTQVKRLLEGPRKSPETGRPRAPEGQALPTAPHAPGPETRGTSRAPLAVSAAIGAVAALALIVWFGATKMPTGTPAAPAKSPASAPAERAAAPAAVNERSIAVLPFANLGGDKDSEYFSDGLTEEILNALARDPALRVAARTSSFAFKGRNASVQEVGRTLRAAKIIDGSVRKAGTRVRIAVQLINAADGYQLWSDQFDRELTDIFAVQEEIAARIAQKLGGPKAAAPAAATAGGTKNLAAYDAYLRGRAAQTSGFSEQLSAQTIRHYEEAVGLDSGYALAWARLAEAYARVRNSGYDRGEGLKAKGVQAAQTALRLAPILPEALLARALVAEVFEPDVTAAQQALDRLQQLRPNDAELPAARARIERSRGVRGAALVELARRAVAADPQNADTLVVMAGYLGECGQFGEAVALCDRAWSLAQVAEDPLRVKVINLIAWKGDVDAALAVLEQTPEHLREVRYHYRRGDLLFSRGDIAGAENAFHAARRNVQERFADRAGPRHSAAYSLLRLAQIDARRGDQTRAAKQLEQALVEAEQLHREYPDSTTYITLRAIALALLGRGAEAAKALAEAERTAQRSKDQSPVREYLPLRKAMVLGLLGRPDEAVIVLRQLHDAGFGFGYALRRSYEYESLRTHPQFQQLMKDAEARANAVPAVKS